MSTRSAIFLLSLCTCAAAQAATVEQFGGPYANWPAVWTPIPGVNDPHDPAAPDWLDFVGDATDPGGYYASDANYVYIRVRVHDDVMDAADTAGSMMILIDRPGLSEPGRANYAFAWDRKNGNSLDHGLEMMVPAVVAAQWNQNRMDDLDGSNGQKLAIDINGPNPTPPPPFRTAEGYIRSIDQQPTTNFGPTSVIDFAVSWNYLEDPTRGLSLSRTDNDWRFVFASIVNANDHGFLDTDISGGANPSSPVEEGWGGFEEPEPPINGDDVPEPASLILLASAAAGLGGYARRRRTA